MSDNPKPIPKGDVAPMMFYIDGQIDTIKIVTGSDGNIQFSILPSSEFLKTVTETKNGAVEIKKKALFIKGEEPDFAYLRNVAQSESEKDIVWFSIAGHDDSSLKCLLLEAKNNRNTVRVLVAENDVTRETGEEKPKQAIDILTASAIQIL